MSLSILFGGTIAPFLLMFSPLSWASVRDCMEWNPPAKAVDLPAGKRPCPRKPLLLLM